MILIGTLVLHDRSRRPLYLTWHANFNAMSYQICSVPSPPTYMHASLTLPWWPLYLPWVLWVPYWLVANHLQCNNVTSMFKNNRHSLYFYIVWFKVIIRTQANLSSIKKYVQAKQNRYINMPHLRPTKFGRFTFTSILFGSMLFGIVPYCIDYDKCLWATLAVNSH